MNRSGISEGRMQFQSDLSMAEFFARYGTEAQCAARVQRWPGRSRAGEQGAVRGCGLAQR